MPAGYIDPTSGQYIYGTTDPYTSEAIADMLNRGQQAARTASIQDRGRLDTLEDWVGDYTASTPWADVPRGAEFAGNPDGGLKLRWRRSGPIVYVEGVLRTDADGSAVYAIMGTMPAGARPLAEVFTLAQSSNGGQLIRVRFHTSGSVQTYSPLPANSDITFQPLSYFIN